MEGEKLQNVERTFFFFFCISLFKTTEICFGSTGKKHFTPGKNSGKITLPPLKNKRPWFWGTEYVQLNPWVKGCAWYFGAHWKVQAYAKQDAHGFLSCICFFADSIINSTVWNGVGVTPLSTLWKKYTSSPRYWYTGIGQY